MMAHAVPATVHNLPEDVLQLIFEQEVLNHKRRSPARWLKDASAIIEDDSNIQGEEWVMQAALMDSGVLYHNEARWQPNHDLHRLLFVCKSWMPVVRRQLYQSVAIGYQAGHRYDAKGFVLLLRALKSSPTAASAVQHLTLLGAAFPDHQKTIDWHLTVVTALFNLCPNLRTLRLELDKGSPKIREALRAALFNASLLESVTLEANLSSRDVDDFEYWLFQAEEHSISLREHLHTLVFINEDISQIKKQKRFRPVVDMKKSETVLTQLPCLRKLCMYHFQPSYPLLRSLHATPSPMRVFRCWLSLSVAQEPEYFELLRSCLAQWAPTLQRLTLTWKYDDQSNHHRIRLGLVDDTIAEHFRDLVELQTAACIMPPSCIVRFPNLRLLEYDTMEIQELETLRRAILEHKALRCLTFHTRLPALRPNRARRMDRPDELDDNPDAFNRILGLQTLCKSRGILFENSYEQLDDFDDFIDDMDDTYHYDIPGVYDINKINLGLDLLGELGLAEDLLN